MGLQSFFASGDGVSVRVTSTHISKICLTLRTSRKGPSELRQELSSKLDTMQQCSLTTSHFHVQAGGHIQQTAAVTSPYQSGAFLHQSRRPDLYGQLSLPAQQSFRSASCSLQHPALPHGHATPVNLPSSAHQASQAYTPPRWLCRTTDSNNNSSSRSSSSR